MGEDADIIDDQAAPLTFKTAVGPRDGLHQGVVAHRFVEIER